jgi:hydroxymethylglutaryl-CoA reductase
MGTRNSRISGFYHLSPRERLEVVRSFDGLNDEDLRQLHGGNGALTVERADKMIENVIGTFELPLGIATNFLINGRDVLIPMVVEEPSIVAGASYAAKLVRDGGGFQASSTPPLMIGQVQLVHVADPQRARYDILAQRDALLALANRQSSSLVALGGGAKDIEVRFFETSPMGPMLVVHLIIDCRDAMGRKCNQYHGGSGGADARRDQRRQGVPAYPLEPERPTPGAGAGNRAGEVAGARWSERRGGCRRYSVGVCVCVVDPYRATTHNKGILNGIDPVLIATGNDWRAVEAGAHAYAARNGRYTSLSHWERDAHGNLVGTLEMPLAVGVVGGATKVHPAAQVALKLIGVAHAHELAEICVCAVWRRTWLQCAPWQRKAFSGGI